ncbi:hypothetical protein [Limosilactobacillus fastidiosus]|uniref:DUF1516 family protein n=1 Tax=Limosilactobacillus fastidiosus TaxID=2759855 RepID=A0A7W3U0T2_9LACO|nr:hypothetical protein [Limosilactobacillus fastidiosus]MBB1086812.1 hypothetical protein [Limosilactobacillus fastidiosus]MCD7085461.1 hypothetical protein [Limosilactobacillus fastidiosus]MCD7114692.1 hypothetical protein [Limosilactobacillus fastidiosus]MCD7116059.1 hypothetical protein [Limosilactobacillus fastidiosus]
MLNLLILFASIILLIASTTGLHAKMEKHVNTCLIITRCFFFILLTCQIIQLFLTWKTRLLTNLIWLIFSIMLFAFTANAFREKIVTFGNPRHLRLVFGGMIINLCLSLITLLF